LPNYKLTIQYNGRNYSGWQIQQGQSTVQQTIKDIIEMLIRETITLHGSGRTDSGVHALGQVANFSCAQELDLYRFRYSLNNTLPDDISVPKISLVDDNFHSRFDATRRIYFYVICKSKTPFFRELSYFYYSPLNIRYLNELSNFLIGESDYSAFTKHASETENKVCNISSAQWKHTGEFTFFKIEANRFLHGMVRTIVGTLLNFHKEQMPFDALTSLIASKDRTKAGEAVPAKGLFLYKVVY